MNIETTDLGNPDRVAVRRAANDAFRATLTGGCLVLSPGIVALGASNQARIIEAVRRCVEFADDDPFDAHDIGDVAVDLDEPGIARWRELIFFRVRDLALPGADAPSLVMTLMLASEW